MVSRPDDNSIQFRALQVANQHRNAYGLRYNDFTRYRKHCGNRTHRLRSSLKMTHGKGRDFKKLPPITLENIKPGHLELLLFETERAWAYSQDLYTASVQNKEHETKLRHTATGRFRRAIHWCTQLLSHCQALHAAQRISAENLLEINAYTLILSGRFLRFRNEYEDALDQLCVARDILDLLADCAESSKDQALATLFSDEIAPEIRYCAHQLGQKDSYDIDRIVKEAAPKRRDALVDGYAGLIERLRSEGHGDATTQGRKRLQELVWEGEPIPVRNPELVGVLLRVQDAEGLLKAKATTDEKEDADVEAKQQGKKRHHKTRKGVAAFDAILAALSDAEEVARKLAEAQKATGGSTTSSLSSRDIHFLHDYIVYNLLSRRVERDLTLISALITSSQSPRKHTEKSTSKKDCKAPAGAGEDVDDGTPRDDDRTDARVNPAIVKLLNTVVQSLEHMRSLSIVEEAPDLATAVEVRLAFTKSRRCVYLARSYAAVKQYAQALALCQRSHIYIREASSTLSATSPTPHASFYPITLTGVNSLEQLLLNDEERLKRDWFAYNGGSPAAQRDTSKKPLFFDIALNHVQLDIERLQERAGLAVSPKKDEKVTQETPRAAVTPVAKAKMEEIERPATPEPVSSRAGGGLSSLLGGWWGRK
ncbi:SRP68 [Sanghuangporus weigelae]